MMYYEPDWEIRINTEHILSDEQNVQRLPEYIRNAWNLPLMLETAVELARRRAKVDWPSRFLKFFREESSIFYHCI